VKHGHDQDPVYGITTAQQSHMADIARRQKQYTVTMLFRVAAVLVVVFVPGLTIMERVVLGIAATVIPYVAVIRANAGPPPEEDPTNLILGKPDQASIGRRDTGLPGGGAGSGEGFTDAGRRETQGPQESQEPQGARSDDAWTRAERH
jgi:Protein of unknown function (DUF3099)